MKLNYVKMNPVENMTIFIMDKVPRASHMKIANRLMDYNNLHGEQVGFIEEPTSEEGKAINTLRLQMMGGEFCGNATRSLAALAVHNNLIEVEKKGNKREIYLEVSGMDGLIQCTVESTERENVYYSSVEMPLPTNISDIVMNYNDEDIPLTRVDFPGITHFIVDGSKVDDGEKFFLIVKNQMEKEVFDAFGIMFYDFGTRFLTPLVYVRSTDSKYWERSCGSGTCALGAALAFKENKSIKEEVSQPGGKLEVNILADDSGKMIAVTLNGEVEIVSEGTVYMEDQLI